MRRYREYCSLVSRCVLSILLFSRSHGAPLAGILQDANSIRQSCYFGDILEYGEDSGPVESNAEAGPVAIQDQDEGACGHG